MSVIVIYGFVGATRPVAYDYFRFVSYPPA